MRGEIQQAEERLSDQLSENSMLKETNNRLMMSMQEKDFELKVKYLEFDYLRVYILKFYIGYSSGGGWVA